MVHRMVTTYLDLAIREGLPVATLDKGLRRAAIKAGVSIYRENA